ncbi:MAG: VOC family protein [Proteobacteria bacterium]|nr:VOC family protein [Pseudomonadota bacterium]
MFTKVTHVGLVVKDIEEALTQYTEVLGISTLEARMDLSELGFKNAMLRIGDFGIELMQTTSTDPNHEFNKFLDKQGEGTYHLCVTVDDLDAHVRSLKEKGAEVLEVPASPSVGARRAFVKRRSANGLLIEMFDQKEYESLSGGH